MTIEESIYRHSIATPDKIALIQGDTAISYQQLWETCRKMASLLKHSFRVANGERVILSAAGSIEFIYAYLGTHLAGGIAVPIDPDTNQTRFDYIVDSTKPSVTLGSLSKVKDGAIAFECLNVNECTPIDVTFPDKEEIADVLFTTGTTGAPKGVALSYKNLAAAARNINEFIRNASDDVELLALPVSHSFGLGRLRCVLSLGGTVVVLGTFANVKRLFSAMSKYSATGFAMVPASWAFIKKMSGKYIGKFANQLKYVEIGSSFMPVEEKELLMTLLPDTRICMHYGLTEASRSAFMEFHSERDNLATAGKASPHVEIAVMDSHGKPLPYGEEGEVCVKGEHVCQSYWNETPERFRQDFYGGFFRTGDCATMRPDGYIYLKSRIKEIINVGGKKVAPTEVEDILNAVPGIKESACVAIPDPDGVMGEVVKAFIVTSDELTDFISDELTDEVINKYLKSQLTDKLEVYKIPVAFERIAEIPKTPSGKIQRLKLKN